MTEEDTQQSSDLQASTGMYAPTHAHVHTLHTHTPYSTYTHITYSQKQNKKTIKHKYFLQCYYVLDIYCLFLINCIFPLFKKICLNHLPVARNWVANRLQSNLSTFCCDYYSTLSVPGLWLGRDTVTRATLTKESI